MVRSATLLVMLVAAMAAQAQSAYRWVDKDGRVHYSDQPPPAEAKKVERRNLSPNSVETSELPYATRRAARDFPVVLYSHADCAAVCGQAREFLKRRGIPYREKFISTPQDFDEFKKTFKSEPFTPSLAVGSQAQKGFEEEAWAGLLDTAGYPRSIPPRAKLPSSGASSGMAPHGPAASAAK